MNRGGPAGRAAVLILCACLTGTSVVRAQTAPLFTNATIATGGSPVVRIQMRSGKVTIRTANRSDVRISATSPVAVRTFPPNAVAQALRPSIPIFTTTVLTKNGPLILPPEEFPLALPNGPHDAIFVQGMDADVTVTIPAGAVLVLVNVGRGQVNVQGYRGGNFLVRVHGGGIRLLNSGGNGYAEVARGPILAADSSFDRLRARTAVGNLFFERCISKQIDVSSINGSIVYDDGSFEPGAARFETLNGDVALGVARGGVRIGAHSSVGRIVSSLNVNRTDSSDAIFEIGGINSDVTASSERGTVFLYAGAFARLHPAGTQWSSLARLVRQRAPSRRPAISRHTRR